MTMDWKTLLAYISGSVDEELLLRNEYVVEENRILRNQIEGRVPLTDAERQTLAEIGKKLGKQALEEIATIVKPGYHPGLASQAGGPEIRWF
jgi:hypothetical protein